MICWMKTVSGTRVHYEGQPGEQIKLLKDGRAIVAHPEHAPKVVNLDGTVETLTRENHPDIWAVFEDVVKQLLHPN